MTASPALPELHMKAGVGDEQGAADQSANTGRDPAVVPNKEATMKLTDRQRERIKTVISDSIFTNDFWEEVERMIEVEFARLAPQAATLFTIASTTAAERKEEN